jgi:antitoxin MazE
MESRMKTRVQKWGNSLAVRIPRSFAAETGMEKDTLVDLSLEEGKLVLTPLRAPGMTLEQLLEGVTGENLHGEWGTGPAAGNEAW